MKKYMVLYFAAIAQTLFGFFVLLKSLDTNFELWRVICALISFLIFLALTLFFLARLRKTNGG